MGVLFGPAGGSDAFSRQYKSSSEAPKYLAEMGLDCFEYQCGRGVNIGQEACARLGGKAAEYNIRLSLHSPYFINLSSSDPERVEKNINYIMQSAQAISWMGGDRVVVHCGGLSGMSREEAVQNTKGTLRLALSRMEEQGLGNVALCVETMGKVNVLGDQHEVFDICLIDERLRPCVDFGHLNARTGGGMTTKSHFTQLLDDMENALGVERARSFHVHFSKIQYSKGGEVKHLTFEDTQYGPGFDHLAELFAQRGYNAYVICESAGTQDADALAMKNMYLNAMKNV